MIDIKLHPRTEIRGSVFDGFLIKTNVNKSSITKSYIINPSDEQITLAFRDTIIGPCAKFDKDGWLMLYVYFPVEYVRGIIDPLTGQELPKKCFQSIRIDDTIVLGTLVEI